MKQVAGQVGVNRPADSIDARHAQEFPEPLSASGRAPEAAQRRRNSMRRANSWKIFSIRTRRDLRSDGVNGYVACPVYEHAEPAWRA